MEESHETIIAIGFVTFILFLILLGGFIILNRRISEKTWRPFHISLEKVKAFDLQSLQPLEFEPTDIIEFEVLHYHLHKLSENNISTFRQQKEFTENASHELQTPLSIVQSKLDLLLQSKQLSEEQSTIIDQTQYALARVSRINKNLLLLARLENGQFPEKETVDLSAILENNMDFLRDFAADKTLMISQQISPAVKITTNKDLLEVLLTNLLLNAIRHTKNNGTISVTLDETGLSVSNSGTDPLLQDKLFKRFSTASSRMPGTGLGLAIVKQICLLYGWQTSYTFKNGLHIFTVRF